jgi:hypothetical protein
MCACPRLCTTCALLFTLNTLYKHMTFLYCAFSPTLIPRRIWNAPLETRMSHPTISFSVSASKWHGCVRAREPSLQIMRSPSSSYGSIILGAQNSLPLAVPRKSFGHLSRHSKSCSNSDPICAHAAKRFRAFRTRDERLRSCYIWKRKSYSECRSRTCMHSLNSEHGSTVCTYGERVKYILEWAEEHLYKLQVGMTCTEAQRGALVHDVTAWMASSSV